MSILFFIGKTIKDLVYPFVAFILSSLFRNDINWLWFFAGIALFLMLLLALSILTWYRFIYFPEMNSLRVEHGLLVRKKLWITRESIQSIDVSAGVLQRLFGLVKLQVETAGGKNPEVVLSAITSSEARRIREFLAGAQPHTSNSLSSADVQETPGGHFPMPVSGIPSGYRDQIQLSIKDLFIFSATSGRIGVVIALFGAAYSQLDDWLERTFDVWGWITFWLGSARIGSLIVLLLVVAWVLAIIITAVKEYGFRLTLSEDLLIIERGLLERKQVTVPLNRIQAVHLASNALRRPFGLVSVYIISAGYAGKEGQSALLFPLLRKKELESFLSRFTPQFKHVSAWKRLEKRALRSYMLLPFALSALFVIPAIVWIPQSYGYYTLIMPPAALFWSWLRFKETGWSTDGEQLYIRYGSFVSHQVLIPKQRIQWNLLSQSPIQEGKLLATFQVALASSTAFALFRIRHMPATAGYELKDWASAGRKK
ncbi:PH domain-containing protein [Paenibacillus tarimensis]